jgi:hypothetical protein
MSIWIWDGFVPSKPTRPVVQGLSSGTTALPNNALTIGAPSSSATCYIFSVALSAPPPAKIATPCPAFKITAARCQSSGSGSSIST